MSRPLSINEQYAAIRQANGGELPASGFTQSHKRSAPTLANPPQWFIDALGVSKSGVAVNDESALTLSAVYACNRVLAESLAQLPIALMKRTGEKIEVADKRPEHTLVSVSPSDLYTSYTFRATGQFHLGMRGNFYARIFRDGRGGAREMKILHPTQVQPFFYNSKLFYRVSPNYAMGDTVTKTEVLTPDDILHVPALSSDGIIGRSPIAVLRETIGIGLSNRDFLSQVHQSGGRLRGIIKHDKKATKEQVAELRENFKDPINNGEFPVLQDGWQFQTVSLTPAESEFINTAKLTVQDIYRAYRVQPHMIGDLERATFSNIEQQSLEFVKYTMLPWIKNWESELNRKLLPVDIRNTHYFRFNVDGMLRGDLLSRYRAYAIGRQWGFISADEIREMESKNPLPDGQGKIYLTPLNMATADDLLNDTPSGGNQDTDEQGNKRQPAATS